jgi:hypothetical protein
MKYVISTVLDQTIGWITPDGAVTTRPSEAQFFDTAASAEEAANDSNGQRDPDLMVDPVEDETAFRAQSPTWEGRPYTPEALFDLVKLVASATQTSHTKELVPNAREEVAQLFAASWALLEKLGHNTPKDWWVFGPAPAPTDKPAA